jgi:hypothetical protein
MCPRGLLFLLYPARCGQVVHHIKVVANTSSWLRETERWSDWRGRAVVMPTYWTVMRTDRTPAKLFVVVLCANATML